MLIRNRSENSRNSTRSSYGIDSHPIDLSHKIFSGTVHFMYKNHWKKKLCCYQPIISSKHRWKRLQMGRVIVVFILYLFLSALLRLESKLIVAACRDASVIRGIFRVRTSPFSSMVQNHNFSIFRTLHYLRDPSCPYKLCSRPTKNKNMLTINFINIILHKSTEFLLVLT
jgi:hypothetical protein